MSFGPIELLMVKFPGNKFSGTIAPALAELVDNGTIRVVDILFIRKDESGGVTAVEINDLDEADYAVFDPIVSDISSMLSAADVEHFAKRMENNSSAGIMVFENVWATRFVDAVADSHGEVVLNERIPRAVVEQAIQSAAEVQ